MGGLGSADSMGAAKYALSHSKPKGARFVGKVVTKRSDGNAYVADSVAHESWKENNDELSERLETLGEVTRTIHQMSLDLEAARNQKEAQNEFLVNPKPLPPNPKP